MADHFAPEHLIGHVTDGEYFEVPRFLANEGKLYVPQLRDSKKPICQIKIGYDPIDQMIEPVDFRLTKFMCLEVVAAVLVAFTFIRLANRMSAGNAPRGRIWNLLEAMLVFIRDEVARPAIGKHAADKYLPFLWTIFFFVLACNLLGLVPWAGSPTGALATTGTLALITFVTVMGAGMMKLGVLGFWKAQVPHMKLPLVMAIPLIPMIFVIEVLGLFIKHFVLAVRLLANMMAGHMVLAVLIAFIGGAGAAVYTWYDPLFLSVAAVSILGAVLLSLLELFVAFLQAYIFAFLSALFIGMAVHPH